MASLALVAFNFGGSGGQVETIYQNSSETRKTRPVVDSDMPLNLELEFEIVKLRSRSRSQVRSRSGPGQVPGQVQKVQGPRT